MRLRAEGSRSRYDSNLHKDMIYFCTDTKEILYKGESYGEIPVKKVRRLETWSDDIKCVLEVRQDGKTICFSGEIGGYQHPDNVICVVDVPPPANGALRCQYYWEGWSYELILRSTEMGARTALCFAAHYGGEVGSGSGGVSPDDIDLGYYRIPVNMTYIVD